MGFLRRDHDLDGTRYVMREKMFSVGDDFWIEVADGQRVFKVNGKALRVRDTFVLEGSDGNELYRIKEKALTIRESMKIERGGETVARIKKALISPLKDRFVIDIEDAGDLEAKGSILDHEFEIERDGEKIAEVSKRWFRVRDSYGIEIA